MVSGDVCMEDVLVSCCVRFGDGVGDGTLVGGMEGEGSVRGRIDVETRSGVGLYDVCGGCGSGCGLCWACQRVVNDLVII